MARFVFIFPEAQPEGSRLVPSRGCRGGRSETSARGGGGGGENLFFCAFYLNVFLPPPPPPGHGLVLLFFLFCLVWLLVFVTLRNNRLVFLVCLVWLDLSLFFI